MSQAEAFIGGLLEESGGSEWVARAKFRAMCRRSLFYFAKTTVCVNESPNLLTARTFKGPCDFVQHVLTDGKRGLLEDPRNHAKSTYANRGGVGWIAIQRPHEEYDHPNEIKRAQDFMRMYPAHQGVDSVIVVASESDKVAKAKWGKAALTMFESNELFRWGFPELVWANSDMRTYGHWSESMFTPAGRVNPLREDDFFRVQGIKSKSSGGRADFIFVDDLVSEESNESPTELAYRCSWLRSITQLLKDHTLGPSGSPCLYINNRWNFDDPNSMIHDELRDWKVWSRASWVCGFHGRDNCGRKPSDAEDIPCTPTDESLWPERHPDLDAIRRNLGDFIFYTQWGNAPAQKAELDASMFMPFRTEIMAVDGKPRELCVVIDNIIDEQTKEPLATAEVIPVSALAHHYISIDPAGADEESEMRKKGKTARWCASWFALDPPTGRVFWLDCRAEHWPPAEAIEQCFALWRDASNHIGRPAGIVCERVATQTSVASAIKFKAQSVRAAIPKIDMIGRTGGVHKDVRIRNRTGLRLQQRRLFLRDGLLQPRNEIRRFPTGSKDTLDTEAQVEDRYLELQGASGGDSTARRARRKRRRQRALMTAGPAGV